MGKLSLCAVGLACVGLFAALAVRFPGRERVARIAETEDTRLVAAAIEDQGEATPTVSVSPLIARLTATPLEQNGSPPVMTSPESDGEMVPDVVLADRRAAMAQRWGLTESETVAFDSATEAPSQERMEVMLRHAQGKIAQSDLSAELKAADERGLQRVHSVLGDERFNEYLSIRWRLETDEPEAVVASGM